MGRQSAGGRYGGVTYVSGVKVVTTGDIILRVLVCARPRRGFMRFRGAVSYMGDIIRTLR